MMRASRCRQGGFTLIELSFVVAIIAIIGALALPSYRDYVERASLAAVLVQYDAMRVQAKVTANDAGRDLCQWQVTWEKDDGGNRQGGKTIPDANTRLIEDTINAGIAALDPKRWRHDLNHFTGPGDSAAPLTVQFAGIGADGVQRTHLLAAEMQKIGLFNRWEKNLKSIAVFTAFLGDCGMAPAGAASPAIVGGTSTGTTRSPAPACKVTEQVSADGVSCAPKTCPAGQTLDAATGNCKPVPTGPQPAKVFHFPDNLPGTPADKSPYCKVDAGDAHNTGVRFGDACHAPCMVKPTDTQPTGFIVDGQCMPLGGGRTLADTYPTPAPDPRWGGRAPTTRYCYACNPGGADTCEYEYLPTTCDAPANYCVNQIRNQGGTAAVTRRCGTIDDVYQVWSGKGNTSPSCNTLGATGSASDVDDGASCTYVCTGDACNQPVSTDRDRYDDHSRPPAAP